MDEWVTVENGCICCSSKNDMVKALEALMQQRDRFDYVVIETTGGLAGGCVVGVVMGPEGVPSPSSPMQAPIFALLGWRQCPTGNTGLV